MEIPDYNGNSNANVDVVAPGRDTARTMSQENGEVVRRAYDAWNRDDFDSARAILHPNVEWQSSGVFPGFEPLYRGHDGVRDWWEALKAPWQWFVVHVERTVDAENTVLVATRFEAVGKDSGVKVDMPFANVWWLEDGLVVRFAAYSSWEQALEAVGLSG